ncbi:hypothetical protein H310_14147, partial [Aphanomyces invadans]
RNRRQHRLLRVRSCVNVPSLGRQVLRGLRGYCWLQALCLDRLQRRDLLAEAPGRAQVFPSRRESRRPQHRLQSAGPRCRLLWKRHHDVFAIECVWMLCRLQGDGWLQGVLVERLQRRHVLAQVSQGRGHPSTRDCVGHDL